MKYCKGLDGLRGIAVIMVVAVHAYYLGPQFESAEGFLAQFLRNILNCGWVGVDLFFALSGFLITTIQVEEKAQGFTFREYIRRFYTKRVLRIFPLYYAMLLACYLGSLFAIHPTIDDTLHSFSESGWIYILFLSNYTEPLIGTDPASSHLLGMTWSLATEEQYYLIWPVILYYVKPSKLIPLLLGLLIALPILRYLMLDADISAEFIYSASISHIDSIVAGSLLAMVYQHKNSFSINTFINIGGLLGGFLILIGVLHSGGNFHYLGGPAVATTGYTGLALFFTWILHVVYQNAGFRKVSCLNALCLFGKYAYFIYLFHMFLMVSLSHFRLEMGDVGILGFAVYTAFTLLVSLVLGHLSFCFFESPFMKLRRRYL